MRGVASSQDTGEKIIFEDAKRMLGNQKEKLNLKIIYKHIAEEKL